MQLEVSKSFAANELPAESSVANSMHPLLHVLADRVQQIALGDPWWHRAIQLTGADHLPLESAERPLNSGRTAVLLAGGVGRRLFPVTEHLNKHLLPVAGQPVIFYPMNALLSAGVTNVVIVSSPRDLRPFQELFGYGERLGINIAYRIQDKPDGTSVGLTCARDLVHGRPIILAFGDNILHGPSWYQALAALDPTRRGATLFGIESPYAERFGVIEVASHGRVEGLIEKPRGLSWGTVTPGFYAVDSEAIDAAFQVPINARQEFDTPGMLTSFYLPRGLLQVVPLAADATFFDAGHPDTIAQAHEFMRGVRATHPWAGDPHATARHMGLLSRADLQDALRWFDSSSRYGERLAALAR